MTKEEKQLLLQDLCSRLPYRVRCKCINGLGGGETDHGVLKFIGNCNGVISNYYEDIPIDSGFVNNVFYPIENIKPYLRPMPSMTEEERKEWFKQSRVEYDCEFHTEPTLSLCNCHLSTDWLNKKMFDYRGLIPMGLALPAKEGMYNKMEE